MYLTPDQANLPKGVCIADGCDLRVAGVIIEGLDRETQRHHEFAKWRVPGTELFEMSPEVTSHIDVVRATFGEPTRYLDVA